MTNNPGTPPAAEPNPVRPARPGADQGLWTEERIRALGAVTDLPTAASIFGLSRTVAYELARHERFPVPVIRAGTRYRVAVAAILAVLHQAPQPAVPPPT